MSLPRKITSSFAASSRVWLPLATLLLTACFGGSEERPPPALAHDLFSEARLGEAQEGPQGVRAGTLKVGSEIRQVLEMRAPASHWWEVRGGPGARLLFGLMASRENRSPVTVRLRAAGTVHFEERLEAPSEAENPSHPSWGEREVILEGCPPRGCHIGFEVDGGAAGQPPSTVYLSNVTVVNAAPRQRPNLILISLGALGADHLSTTEGPAGTTPYLDELAEQGVLFENAFSSSSTTVTAHGSMLTGSAPFETAFYWLDGELGREPTVAERLRRHGYLTAAFTGGTPVKEQLAFDRGFEVFYQHDTLERPPLERSDIEPITDHAAAWARRHGGAAFFLFVQTQELHSPYLPRHAFPGFGGALGIGVSSRAGALPIPEGELARHLELHTPEGPKSFADLGRTAEVGPLRDAYRSEIRYLDRSIRFFLDRLEDDGLLKNALVIVTADHGTAFFEHGHLGHGLLHDENLRVPLILWSPGQLPNGRRVHSHVTSQDVATTLLDAAGLEAPDALTGRSLLPLARGKPGEDRDFYSLVLGNGLSFHQGGRHKLILRAALGQDNYGRHQLFDLLEDPREKKDLLEQGVEIPPAVEKQVAETVERFPGLHLDLSAFAGSTWELEFPAGPSYRDDVYAFRVDRLDLDRSEPSVLRCTLRPKENARLIYRSRNLDSKIHLILRSETGEALRFNIQPTGSPGQHHAVAASAGGPEVIVWRVDPPRAQPRTPAR